MIRFDDVSFKYPGADIFALEEVSLSIDRGGVTLVSGPVGAGCSTLLLIAGGIAPALTAGKLSGKVTTLDVPQGDSASRARIASRVGLLLPTPWTQLSGVAFTVRDEVAFGPANLGRARADIARSVERAMTLANVTHLAGRDPATLSGGELQRVMLAGIIALEPEIYLLDEPAVELDPGSADALYRILPELARDAAVVVATTDLDSLAEVAAQVILLDGGRCVADGSAAAVFGAEEVVSAGRSTTIAQIARASGFRAPYPFTPEALARGLKR